jgi:hypothetical protein
MIAERTGELHDDARIQMRNETLGLSQDTCPE